MPEVRKFLACAVIAAALLSPTLAAARGGGGGGHGHASSYCASCARDSHGRIARSPEARQEFMTQTGYPHGRPGYVVDHIIQDRHRPPALSGWDPRPRPIGAVSSRIVERITIL
jgi:hypothetical protein